MTEAALIDGLYVLERDVDESERRQGVVRRFEVRDPMCLPPNHLKSVIQQPRTGDMLCSCRLDVQCRHTAAVLKYLERRGPSPVSGPGQPAVA